MREIISVQVGQCGNQIGSSFWETISEEHQINPDGFHSVPSDGRVENLDMYYNENRGGTYSARALLVDLEPGVIDSILAGKYGRLFKH